MALLAIDTCMAACSAAVLRRADGAREPVAEVEYPGRGHAELIMPMIVRVMARAECVFEELSRIAVTVGPGSFSGVRVGVAAARGLALASGAGTIGFSSLAVMAQGARRLLDIETDQMVVVGHDARRGQVYFGRFEGACADGGELLLTGAGDAAARAARGETIAGSGAALIAAAAPERGLRPVLPDLLPDARDLARMAWNAEPQEAPVSPLYLRPPDAKPQTGKAVPRRP